MFPVRLIRRKLEEKTYTLRTVGRVHTSPIEKEADAGRLLPLAITKCIHELLESRCTLDLKEDLVVVVGHLDVQVFRCRRFFWFAGPRGSVVVGHGLCTLLGSWRGDVLKRDGYYFWYSMKWGEPRSVLQSSLKLWLDRY